MQAIYRPISAVCKHVRTNDD